MPINAHLAGKKPPELIKIEAAAKCGKRIEWQLSLLGPEKFAGAIPSLTRNASQLERKSIDNGIILSSSSFVIASALRSAVFERVLAEPAMLQSDPANCAAPAWAENTYRLFRDFRYLQENGMPFNQYHIDRLFDDMGKNPGYPAFILGLALRKKAAMYISYGLYYADQEEPDLAQQFILSARKFISQSISVSGDTASARRLDGLAQLSLAGFTQNKNEYEFLFDSASIDLCLSIKMYSSEYGSADFQRKQTIATQKLPRAVRLLERAARTDELLMLARQFREASIELQRQHDIDYDF